MVVMAAGVLILTSALKKISEIETEKLLTSVIALGAVMAELVAAQVAISKWAKDGAKHAMSMLAMAAAVRVLAEAVEQLADLGWDGIEKGLIAVAGLLAEVAAFSGLSNFGGLTAGKAVGILILRSTECVGKISVSIQADAGRRTPEWNWCTGCDSWRNCGFQHVVQPGRTCAFNSNCLNYFVRRTADSIQCSGKPRRHDTWSDRRGTGSNGRRTD